jgi:hypothetical protein
MSSTKDWLKKSSCEPAVRKARAIPPRPIKTPPIPTQKYPLGASFARNGPRKMTSPATLWKSGTAILRKGSRPLAKLVTMMAKMPIVANHL